MRKKTLLVSGFTITVFVWFVAFAILSARLSSDVSAIPTLRVLSDAQQPQQAIVTDVPDTELIQVDEQQAPVPNEVVVANTGSSSGLVDNPTDEPAPVVVAQSSSSSILSIAGNTAGQPQINQPNVEPIVVTPPQEAVPNQIVLRFDPNSTVEQREEYVRSISGMIVETIDALNTIVVDVPATVTMNNLPTSSIMMVSEPNFYASALIDVPTSDPYYDVQWAIPVINAPEAWLAMPEDAPIVKVAVIDSGICANHPDLQGRILPGWDFVQDDDTPQDEMGHGCGVAGIIAANVDNGIGIAGVAPNTQIIPLRVLDARGVGTYADVAAAIVWATDNSAQIINLSLGGASPSSVLEDAANYAIARDVLIIAAAGNTGTSTVLYPAAYEPVIAVGSVAADLQPSSFSSTGQIDLWAPGRDIWTLSLNNGYTTASGTSFAAPYVSGVAVLEGGIEQTLVVDSGIVSVRNTSIVVVPTLQVTPDITDSVPTTPIISNDIAVDFSSYVLDINLQESVIISLQSRPLDMLIGFQFIITSVRLEGNWVALSIASLDGPTCTPEYVGSGICGGFMLGKRDANQEWDVALGGTEEFTSLIISAPEWFIESAAKQVIDPLQLEAMDTVDNVIYQFPWAVGNWEYRQGWFGESHNGDALDIGTNGEDRRVLAPADGVITYICDVGTQTRNIRIAHIDGRQLEYWHFDMARLGPGIEMFQQVQRGQILGTLKSGPWEWDNCGAAPSQNSAHLHWVIPMNSGDEFTVDGWTIAYSDSTWTNGDLNRDPGGSPYDLLPSTNHILIRQLKTLTTSLSAGGTWPYLVYVSDSRLRSFKVDDSSRYEVQGGCAVWVNLAPGLHTITYWYEYHADISGVPIIEVRPWPIPEIVQPVCADSPPIDVPPLPTDSPSTTATPPAVTPPSGNQDYVVTERSYPANVSPGQQFHPEITVCLYNGVQLRESRGDMLRSVDENVYGAFPHIAVVGTVNSGSCYVFRFYNDFPITAPMQDGTYTSQWKLWVDGNWVRGTEVVITFTVGSGGGEQPTGPQVILFDNTNYGGEQRGFGKGRHDIGGTNFNDRASSMTIPDGWSVMLYQDGNFRNTHECFNDDRNELQPPYTNGVSSLQVFDRADCIDPAYPPPGECGGVYLHEDGWLTLVESDENLAHTPYGNWNDRGRYMEVIGPFRGTAYDGYDFEEGFHFGPFTSGIHGIGTNVSSVRVEQTRPCDTPIPADAPSYCLSDSSRWGVYIIKDNGDEMQLTFSRANLAIYPDGWNDHITAMYVI